MKPEDKVKNLLNKLGDYILLGELNYAGILTGYMQNEVNTHEVNVSDCSHNVQDYFYGSDPANHEEYTNINNILDSKDLRIVYAKPAKKKVTVKDTNFYKINKLPKHVHRTWKYVLVNEFEFDDNRFELNNNYHYIQNEDGCSLMSKILCCKVDEMQYSFYDEVLNNVSSYVTQTN